MTEPLPTFRFHPDPVQSGAIEVSPSTCGACGRARGYAYCGPCYVEDEFDAVVCPWCIADGSAFRRFGVTFAEVEPKPGIDLAIAEEIEERTPGITSFNPVDWPVCCGVPMAYLEPAGHTEIGARHPALAGTLVAQLGADFEVPRQEAQAMFQSLSRDHSPCAHVFRCASCARLAAEIDFD